MTNVKPAPCTGCRNSSALFIAGQKSNPLRLPLMYKDGRVTLRILPEINLRLRTYEKHFIGYLVIWQTILSIIILIRNGDKNG